jgi:hypothetical protein
MPIRPTTGQQRTPANQRQQQASVQEPRESIRISFAAGKPVNTKLSYPYNKVYDNATDYVRFDFFKYRPPFGGGAQSSNNTPGATVPGTGNAGQIYNQSIATLARPTDLGANTILMYMPEDISTDYKSDWGGKGFTNIAADVLRGTGNATQGNVGGTIGEIVNSITGAVGRVPSLGAQAIASAINNIPGNIGGSVDINDVLGGIGGVILNPNAELMFTGFEMRSFGLKFKMVASNAQEAVVIRDIITTFKKASLPRLGQNPQDVVSNNVAAIFTGEGDGSNLDNRNYIGIPNLCHVQFMKGTSPHPFLTQYKPCAITNVSVNYTPDGAYATYKGGEPVSIELSLGFSETKLVYSEDIVYGGASF